MAFPSFTGTKAPATPADLQALETEYGFTLPADYKNHLLAHNGGWPADRDTFVQELGDGRRVARAVSDFYSVRHGAMLLEDALADVYDQLHPDLVPFAAEGGGDQFVLSVGPDDYGSVYYVAHELYRPPAFLENDEAEARPRDYGKGVSLLAPSFTAFLEGLVAVPDEG